ncbi:MAG: helix-turn-helix transcriptional regulator [Clostridia bacterium]|nr:helix-turn-helix transcriptional regulator [Clostridia bacterium]
MLKLKALREESGKTQAQIAEIFKISRQVYANYENGINQPSPQMLIVMADYFQCSIDYLLGRSDDFGNITILPDYLQEENFSAEERTLIKEFRSLPCDDKKLLLEYTSFLNGRTKKSK